MSTNKQRRETERAHLQRQLEERREREISHRRFVTIASIVGALVLVAAVVVVIVIATHGSNDKPVAKAGQSNTPTPSPTPTPTAAQTQPAAPLPTTACVKPGKGSTVKYAGLTVAGATNLKKAPTVTGKATLTDPTTVQCDDLVVGTGKAASTSAQATVEYIGLVYKTGKVFQSSWDTKPATFGLTPATPTTQGVIAGFSQGIAGAGKIAPMKVGGRRVIVMPTAEAYGANPPDPSIPANASLVFIVDLQKLAG